jgi:hypothetical protein
MILSRAITAITADNKTFNLPPFTDVRNIRPATDHGFWFEVTVISFWNVSWRQLWAKEVPVLLG